MSVLTIIFGILTFVIGVLFASLPTNARMMDRSQMVFSLVLVTLLIGMLVCMYFVGSDSESWIVLIAAVVGYVVGHLRPINDFLASHWDIFDFR
ncbi:hypothetical protein [Bifidobacterium tissieri]|uniref:Uncharacterized protein n=1 Tax=Bifidobacterium tissieri TaxID=1630162 RepID=A0A5M9ZXX2_9BIFI|nr:hypothetical protein [Bifidobacterium tissieri]KAA8831484.1 hypothetical protein EMO89_01755 [Bifidobacterium tissieri]KAA8832450.1 hypothetical protein EM849_04485 [Bifidobacterium tissieri]